MRSSSLTKLGMEIEQIRTILVPPKRLEIMPSDGRDAHFTPTPAGHYRHDTLRIHYNYNDADATDQRAPWASLPINVLLCNDPCCEYLCALNDNSEGHVNVD